MDIIEDQQMKVVTLNTVKEYSTLAHLPFNRDYRVDRPTLVASIKKYGFITAIYCCYSRAVTGERELYILDGQHRALVAQGMGVPITVCIIPHEPTTVKELIDLVAIYNSTSKKWTLTTYCDAYSKTGVADYVELMRLAEKYNQRHLGVLVSMLSGGYYVKAEYSSKCEKGDFTIQARDETIKTLAIVQDIISSLKKKKYPSSFSGRMISALHKARMTKSDFNVVKFKKALLRQGAFSDLKHQKLDRYDDKFKDMG